jgi:tetratricopeptide (TPR) repeat protein
MRLFATSAIAAALTGALATSALAMGKSNDGSMSKKSGYTQAEQAVKAREYRRAIGMLKKVVSMEPKNVDALNYLGYSYRQIGQYKASLVYYRRALAINPDHRGANEYLGELYLRTGNMKGAKAQLVKLRKLCPRGCEERDTLEAAIAKARKRS